MEFLEKIFGFHYLSLKLSLTLPHKGKMLWCSYFRSFIKLIYLDRCGNLIEKFNFVSTPWKIIIPIANSPPNTPSPTITSQNPPHPSLAHHPPHPSLAHHPPLHPPSKPQPTLPPIPTLSPTHFTTTIYPTTIHSTTI